MTQRCSTTALWLADLGILCNVQEQSWSGATDLIHSLPLKIKNSFVFFLADCIHVKNNKTSICQCYHGYLSFGDIN